MPDDRPVVFSAHGVPKAVPAEAARRKLLFLDATCPLVSKVHREAERHHEGGRTIVLIGHAGHPEVIGTMGQLPAGAVLLVEDVDEAEALDVPDPANLAFATQTTLSVDDTAEIVAALRRRFPAIEGPKKEDICYATTNRQAAVKAIARHCDALVVIGAPNSSNSVRLVEVAAHHGCAKIAPGAARRRHGLELAGGAGRSASRPAPRRPNCWSTSWSPPAANASTSRSRKCARREENVVFKLPRMAEVVA